MNEWKTLSHVRWECKYHLVIVPKYGKRIIYGRLKKEMGKILRELFRQKGVEVLEGQAMADHVPRGLNKVVNSLQVMAVRLN